ncbi:MAG: hypothetical protein LBD43_02580 [Holosporales bacterium]|jgi:hypothetical protein|nr:hypothetical protein [Holosporales bacterium]
MAKRSVIYISAIVAIGGVFLLWKHCPEKISSFLHEGNGEGGGSKEAEKVEKPKKRVIDKEALHYEILALIRDRGETVNGVTPHEAEEELLKRAEQSSAVKADTHDADVTALPFGILRLIATSPATVAGILPQIAINEMLRRYLALKTHNPNDIKLATMLEALQSVLSGNPIVEWEAGDDAEEAEEFLKQLGEEGNQMANIAVAAKMISKDPAAGIGTLDEAIRSINADALDNDDDKTVFNEIVKKTKELHDALTQGGGALAEPSVPKAKVPPETEAPTADVAETYTPEPDTPVPAN